MKIEQENTGLVINEWQLGQQLNSAVHSGTREKFNLLLSLLSDDPRDFSQFAVPAQPAAELNNDNLDLRSAFALPPAQPLVNKGMSLEQASQLNDNLQDNNLSSIRLQLLLANEAVLSRSEAQLIDSDISDNLPPLAQQRLAASLRAELPETERSEDKPSGIDAQLMAQYQALDLDNKPIQVTYM